MQQTTKLPDRCARRGLPLGSVATFLLAGFLLAGFLLSCASWQGVQKAFPDRRGTFAEKMAKVKVGMAREEVIALLGKPGDIATGRDKVIDTANTKEILRYGNGKNVKRFVVDGKVHLRETSGTHLSFPTLGRVYIGGDNTVQYVFGNRPHRAVGIGEAELRTLLELLDEASPYRIGQYTPRTIIDVANALHALGKDKALDVIDEYLRVASPYDSDGEQGLFLVLRALFEVPRVPGHHPPMLVGAPQPAEPADETVFPRFPIALVDDVPYLLIIGYRLGGEAEPLRDHVAYFRKHGVLRPKPLRPAAGGQAPFDTLVAKVRQNMQNADRVVRNLRAQYLSTTGQPASKETAYRPTLEFRLLAYPSAKHLKGLDLATEKERLAAWLEKGDNRQQVQQNPLRITGYHDLSALRGGRISREVRWYPHRVDARNDKKFVTTFTTNSAFANQTVPTFSTRRLDAGPRSKSDYLIEFLAVDIKGRGFDNAEFLWKSMRRGKDIAGQSSLLYELKPAAADAFADVTEKNVDKSLAILLDGYLLSAPTIRSRIPGRGVITGIASRKIDEILQAMRR